MASLTLTSHQGILALAWTLCVGASTTGTHPTSSPPGCASEYAPGDLEGFVYGRIGTGQIASPPNTCEWSVVPDVPLEQITIQTRDHYFSGTDKLDLYTSDTDNSRVFVTFNATRRIHSGMRLTGSNDMYLKLTAASNATFFDLYFECTKTDVFESRVSSLWVVLWLIVLAFLICACCCSCYWLVRHRRRQRERQIGPWARAQGPWGQDVMLSIIARSQRPEVVEAREAVVVAALAAMPTKAWTRSQGESTQEEEEEECCLCMDAFKVTDEIRVLPCNHFFHKDCIDRWFDSRKFRTRSCPLCKRNPLLPHAAGATVAACSASAISQTLRAAPATDAAPTDAAASGASPTDAVASSGAATGAAATSAVLAEDVRHARIAGRTTACACPQSAVSLAVAVAPAELEIQSLSETDADTEFSA